MAYPNIIKNMPILIILMLIFSCVSTSDDQYIKLTIIPESQIVKTLQDAIQNTESSTIPIGDTISSEIGESDPVISLGTKDKYRSNYKLYRFNGKENEIYSVEINTLCDSLSVNKEIMFPLLFIMDSDGNILKHHTMATYETLTSNISGLSQIYSYQEMYSPVSGYYYIMVVSDNSTHKGKTITTIYREPTLKYTLRGLFGKRHPWGSFKLSVKLKQ